MIDRLTSRWPAALERVRQVLWQGRWRRRLTTAALIIGFQGAALAVTYRSVIFQHHTLLTGAAVLGTEAVAPPYGYPGPAPSGYNEVDAGASAWQLVPQIKKAHQELTAGDLPLWDANVMLGAPLAADVEHGMFNPLTWPLVADPTPGVWDAWMLLRLLCAGVLCTYLARYLGLRFVASLLAGLIFMMSGVFQLRTTTIQTSVMAMLPLLILAVERCLRTPSRGSSALLALATASSVLFGMPEETVICLLMAATWFTARFGARWLLSRQFPGREVLYATVGGTAVGVLVSLPLLLPFAEYVTVAHTQHAPGGGAALQVEDVRQLLGLVGPHWTAVGPKPFTATFAPLDNWFGVGALFLAGLGLFSRALHRSVRVLLAVTAIAVEAKVVGFPGWYNQVIAHMPVLGQIALWAYSGVLVSLAVALLAAAGFQRVQLQLVPVRILGRAALVLGVLIAAASPVYLSGTAARWQQVGITACTLLILVAGALLAAHHRSWARRAGVFFVVGSVAAELVLLATPEVPLAVRYDPLASTPTAAYLQQVMPSGTGRSYSPNGILYPTTNQAFNLDDIRNLDALYVERTYRYLKLFVDPGLTDRFDGGTTNAANFGANPFFDALNVERILVGPPRSITNTALSTSQFNLETVAGDGVAIYRNLHASPRAQVIFDTRQASSPDDAVALMSRTGFDPTRSAVVETASQLPSGTQAPVAAHIDRYDDAEVVITTRTQAPGVLVLADAYYPGWQAELDGAPRPIFAANLAMRGVVVPAGTHTVVMRYRPTSLTLGVLGIPVGVTLFGAGAWGVPALLRRRLRHAGSR